MAPSQAEDMRAARDKTSFAVERLRDTLRGGKDKWEYHARIVKTLKDDPHFDKSRLPHLSRKERYKNCLAMLNRLLELHEQQKWSKETLMEAHMLIEDGSPLGLHHVAFLPVILSQGSPEQVAHYGALAEAHAILGCYAQTEIAHGSQVSHLQTTARFIPQSDEFELSTGSMEGTKWWIGALGKFATHAVVQARLLLPDGDKGVHLFILQLRDMETHKTLPGITLGDIGPKAFNGFSTVDNGFMILKNVRVPRNAMLSKFASVTREGAYNIPVHSKLSYGGMIYIRAGMISTAGWTTAKGVTVAIRYATVRRQGNGPLGDEKQVIKYPSLYHRLLPILSRAYVWIFMGREMHYLYNKMSSLLSQSSTILLAETHAVSSALKVLVASSTSADLETARRSMGGHGYSAAAAVGTMWASYVPANTYEGDNYVLCQQVVRSAVKALQRLRTAPDPLKASESLPPSSAFLRVLFSPARVDSEDDLFSVRHAVHLLELRGAHMVANHLCQGEHHAGVDGGADWRVARAVAEAFVAISVQDLIQGLESGGKLAPGLGGAERDVLTKLLRLYLLTTVEGAFVDILSFDLLPRRGAEDSVVAGTLGTFKLDTTRQLRDAIAKLELELLPQAIGLTDAFGFTDWELGSALGVKDGRAYEALWESAQHEPLNASDVVDGYEEYIKPILQRGRRIYDAKRATGAKL